MTTTPAFRSATIACAAVLAAALLACAAPAGASPPPKDSEDWKIMAPYKEWVTSQHDTLGRWCCDIGDGRPVEARIDDDHWVVHVTPAHFPGEAERWMTVPDEKITRNANPTGTPILWLYQGRVQCFAPPDGV
jgi:hypothetical protein